MDNEKIIDILQDRINFHKNTIENLKSYGEQFHDDIKISEGQIMEAREIMRIIFEPTN